MIFIIFLKYFAVFLILWGLIVATAITWHAYFWIDKFDHKNGIQLNEETSWLLRCQRLGALMWLAGTTSMPKIHNFLRKTYQKNVINARYLNLTPETLKSLNKKSWFFFIGIIAFIIGALLAKFLEL